MTESITLYGIANCDTIKKAKAWLTQHQVDFVFHDYRKQGADRSQLNRWIIELGWETLLNKRGTTWRKLPEQVKSGVNADLALDLMLENPAIIRRPVLEIEDRQHVGFSEQIYSEIFKC